MRAGDEKLQHARRLAAQLLADIDTWLSGDNWELVETVVATFPNAEVPPGYRRASTAPGTTEVRSHVKHPAPLAEWALSAGDVIHNLRSALDHAVYEAAAKSGKPFKLRDPQFPAQTKPNPNELNRRTPNASQAFRAVVASFQPYNASTSSVAQQLTLLTELDNLDKHRRLHVVQDVGRAHLAGLGGSGVFQELLMMDADVSQDGALVAVYSGEDVAIHLAQWRYVVLHEGGASRDLRALLTELANAVDSTLGQLDQAL